MSDIFAMIAEWMPQLLAGVLQTFGLMIQAFVFAAVLALPIALGRLSDRPAYRACARTYTEIVRGMPSLTLLLLIYFGLPSFGISLQASHAAVLGLGLNGAAYVSEIYRAGIQAIELGQREAAQMLGMRQHQVLRYVVLPQAFRVVLPPLGNFSIGLLKDTSVASLISAPELMLQARDLTSEYFMPLQIYLVAGGLYLAMALPLSLIVRQLEFRLGARTAKKVT